MSQEELARAVGVSRRWVSSFEQGKATAEVGLVLRTLDALGIVLEARLQREVRSFSSVDLDVLLAEHRQPPSHDRT